MNCLIAGVGGQGTVLASKLIAAAAMLRGMEARTTETIGMAQRGGSVVSHVRMGRDIASPLIAHGTADIVIAFEPAEAVKVLPYLAENGTAIVCDSAVMPITSALDGGYGAPGMVEYILKTIKNATIINGEQLIARCGNTKVLNVALLGAAVQSVAFPFDINDLENAIKQMIAPQYLEINLLALYVGRSMVDEAVGRN